MQLVFTGTGVIPSITVIVTSDTLPPIVIVLNGSAVISGVILTLELGAPLPSGAIIPVVQADSISGSFAQIVVKDVPSRGCRASGTEVQGRGTVGVLLYAPAMH